MIQTYSRLFRIGRRVRHLDHRARRGATPELGDGLERRAQLSIVGLSANASPMILHQINPMNQPHAVQVSVVRPVTVSGYVLEDRPGVVPALSFQVVDEYGRDQPAGTLTPQPTMPGQFFFSTRIGLNRTQRPGDRDGRHYTVFVTAQDPASNRTITIAVRTPHGRRGPAD